jgi:hypothetical protein
VRAHRIAAGVLRIDAQGRIVAAGDYYLGVETRPLVVRLR